jgi:hypothetical protein
LPHLHRKDFVGLLAFVLKLMLSTARYLFLQNWNIQRLLNIINSSIRCTEDDYEYIWKNNKIINNDDIAEFSLRGGVWSNY